MHPVRKNGRYRLASRQSLNMQTDAETVSLSKNQCRPIEFADILSVSDPVDLEVHLTARAQP